MITGSQFECKTAEDTSIPKIARHCRKSRGSSNRNNEAMHAMTVPSALQVAHAIPVWTLFRISGNNEKLNA